MKVFLIFIFAGFVFAQDNDIKNIIANSGSFLDGYELVTQAPLKSIEVLPKCGEGVLKNKFVCVPYYNCDPSTNTVTSNPAIDGSTRINIRYCFFPALKRLQFYVFRFGEDNPKCKHYLEVCCEIGNTSTTTTGPTLPPPVIVDTTPTTSSKPPVPTSQKATCGIRNSQGIDFNFLGGTNEANFGEFPWMVAILRKSPAPGETLSLCGGSLIGPRVILTGAHCVDK